MVRTLSVELVSLRGIRQSFPDRKSENFLIFWLCFWSWQIRFILLQNRQGKTRLAKYYVPLEDSEKHKVEYEVLRSSFKLIIRKCWPFFFFSFLSMVLEFWRISYLGFMLIVRLQVHRLVVNRDSKFTNFVEVGEIPNSRFQSVYKVSIFFFGDFLILYLVT